MVDHTTYKRIVPGIDVSKTDIYVVWCNMKQRCNNPKNRKYPRYGGRGIKYCDEWESFKNFYQDMNPTYVKGLTLDRINNDGNYCKENCRWATYSQQNFNTSKGKKITFRGQTKLIREWAEQLGVSKSTLIERLEFWPIERALTQKADVHLKIKRLKTHKHDNLRKTTRSTERD